VLAIVFVTSLNSIIPFLIEEILLNNIGKDMLKLVVIWSIFSQPLKLSSSQILPILLKVVMPEARPEMPPARLVIAPTALAVSKLFKNLSVAKVAFSAAVLSLSYSA